MVTALISGATSYGQLSWVSRQLDFHPGPADETVVADFEFANAGTTPVNVTDVKTSCGCTTAALDKKSYAPGEKGKISATFHIGDRMGLQQKQVMVSTDHPEEPVVQLTLRAFIPELLKYEPKAVIWPQNSDPSPRIIRVSTGTDQAIHILGVRSSDDRVFAQLRQVEGGKAYDVGIVVNSTKEPLRATVRIETDYPPQKPKVINLPVEVQAPFVPGQTPVTQSQPASAPFPNPPAGFQQTPSGAAPAGVTQPAVAFPASNPTTFPPSPAAMRTPFPPPAQGGQNAFPAQPSQNVFPPQNAAAPQAPPRAGIAPAPAAPSASAPQARATTPPTVAAPPSPARNTAVPPSAEPAAAAAAPSSATVPAKPAAR
jgi:hypothetical protein